MFLTREKSHLKAIPVRVFDIQERKSNRVDRTQFSDQSGIISRQDSANIFSDSETSNYGIQNQLQKQATQETYEDLMNSIQSPLDNVKSDNMQKAGDFIISLTCFIIALIGLILNCFGRHISLEMQLVPSDLEFSNLGYQSNDQLGDTQQVKDIMSNFDVMLDISYENAIHKIYVFTKIMGLFQHFLLMLIILLSIKNEKIITKSVIKVSIYIALHLNYSLFLFHSSGLLNL